MNRWSAAPLALVAAAAAAGCAPAPADLGTSPEILWWTDHETGDFSDWQEGDAGYTWSAQGGQVDVAAGVARSGTHALRASVMSPGAGIRSAGIAARDTGLPVEAYYSAWYYVPAPATATNYWLFFKFRSRTTPSDPSTDVDVWDLDFLVSSGGGMHLSLYHHDTGTEPALGPDDVPVGRWFQIEAFLRATSDGTGRLTVWRDGAMVFDIEDAPTMPSSYVEWSVGGIAEVIAPAGATLYVDDAAISSRRLGPDFPVFWRGD